MTFFRVVMTDELFMLQQIASYPCLVKKLIKLHGPQTRKEA